MSIGLSISFKMYKRSSWYLFVFQRVLRPLMLRLLLVYQLVLRYISVNRETSIGLSFSFKMYKG